MTAADTLAGWTLGRKESDDDGGDGGDEIGRPITINYDDAGDDDDDGGDGEDDDGGDLHASDIVVVETRLQFENGSGGERDHV